MHLDVQSRNFFPFDKYSLIETGSLDALESAITNEIGHHDFSLLRNDQESTSRITCVKLKNISLFGVSFACDLHASTPPSSGLQLITPIRGQVVKHDHDHEFTARPGEGIIMSPGAPVNFDFSSDCVAVVLWVDVHKLSAMTHSVFGSSLVSQFKFPNHISLTRGIGLSIGNMIQTILLELNDEETVFSRGITTKSIEEVLLLSLLHTATGMPNIADPSKDCCSHAMRIALDYIYANVENEISVTDLTEITGVSLRKLQYDFTRAFNAGPMAIIRREKLRRVRQALEVSDPKAVSVAEIAARWAFFDRRYFTRIYMKEFGELPSTTLHRTANRYKI